MLSCFHLEEVAEAAAEALLYTTFRCNTSKLRVLDAWLFFAAATEKPEHGEALGHLLFWSGCEVGVKTCWWRMHELLVNTSPQILSLDVKYGSDMHARENGRCFFLTVGHLLLVQRPFHHISLWGSLESFGGHPSRPWPRFQHDLRS